MTAALSEARTQATAASSSLSSSAHSMGAGAATKVGHAGHAGPNDPSSTVWPPAALSSQPMTSEAAPGAGAGNSNAEKEMTASEKDRIVQEVAAARRAVEEQQREAARAEAREEEEENEAKKSHVVAAEMAKFDQWWKSGKKKPEKNMAPPSQTATASAGSSVVASPKDAPAPHALATTRVSPEAPFLTAPVVATPKLRNELRNASGLALPRAATTALSSPPLQPVLSESIPVHQASPELATDTAPVTAIGSSDELAGGKVGATKLVLPPSPSLSSSLSSSPSSSSSPSLTTSVVYAPRRCDSNENTVTMNSGYWNSNRANRVLVYGMQGSGASIVAYLLAQAPSTILLASLQVGCAVSERETACVRAFACVRKRELYGLCPFPLLVAILNILTSPHSLHISLFILH